jgi:hypothetical protein
MDSTFGIMTVNSDFVQYIVDQRGCAGMVTFCKTVGVKVPGTDFIAHNTKKKET